MTPPGFATPSCSGPALKTAGIVFSAAVGLLVLAVLASQLGARSDGERDGANR
jgi:hypothetical protein